MEKRIIYLRAYVVSSFPSKPASSHEIAMNLNNTLVPTLLSGCTVKAMHHSSFLNRVCASRYAGMQGSEEGYIGP
jgi:hypothetical protein